MLMSLVSPWIEPSEVNIVTGHLTSTLGCNLLSLPSISISLSAGIASTPFEQKSDSGPPLKKHLQNFDQEVAYRNQSYSGSSRGTRDR
jgi:hypothetical protein